MRAWCATAVLAWVTAVLVTSPLLAARSCLACCSQTMLAVAPVVEECNHCHPGLAERPACCAATAPLAGDSCQGCPRCESTRPAPMTPVASVPSWQPADLLVGLVAVVDWPTLSAPAREWLPEMAAGRHPRPPLQILYCTWLT
jgi:hypothetical protein